MPRVAQIARAGFAANMIALGLLGLWFRDFSEVWGRLPGWVPAPAALAYLCAGVALAAGIALLARRTAAGAALVLFVYVGLWWLLFTVPRLFREPLTEASWLECGMYGMLFAGAWTLFAGLDRRAFPAGERGMRAARLLFGLALLPVGLSHFSYFSVTVSLVPQWLPFRPGWAALTGACHLAAGLGVLFRVRPGLAARLEAAMLGVFTVLVWIPAVIAVPASRSNWMELWISAALAAAAGLVAAHIPARHRPAA